MTEGGPRSALAGRAAPFAAGLVVLLAVALLASTLGSVAYGTGVDEGHYVTYARSIESGGMPVFRQLFRDYVADSSRWRYPNPLRVGFIAASGPWIALVDDDFVALSLLSLASYLLALIATWFYSRRFFGDTRACFITALLAFSPLWLGLGRRALLDSFATLWAVLAIWTFLDAVRSPSDWLRRLVFVGVFALALLAKETNALLAFPFVIFLVLERYGRATALSLRDFAVALGGGFAIAGLVWILAAGDLRTLLGVVEIILGSPETNVYANAFGKGPWSRYVIDFVLLSPATTLLGVGGLALVAVQRRWKDTDPNLVYFAVLTICLLVAYDFFTKNVRYVAVLDLCIRILATVSLWEIFRSGRTKLAVAACAGAVFALCWLDYQSFQLIFVDAQLYDPVSAGLLAIREMIPPG